MKTMKNLETMKKISLPKLSAATKAIGMSVLILGCLTTVVGCVQPDCRAEQNCSTVMS